MLKKTPLSARHGLRRVRHPGGALFIENGTLIGNYVLHYEDDSTITIPIVYGEDVRDWWNWNKPPEVTRGQIVWSGQNPMA